MPINDTIQNIITSVPDSLDLLPKTALKPKIIFVNDTIIAKTNASVPDSTMVSHSIDLNIPALLIIVIIGLGIGLYFLLMFLKKYILPILSQRYKKQPFKILWYRFSVVVWLIFGIFSLYIFLKASVLITSLILVFIGILFHQFIIDFMLGIYFQLENHIKIKDRFILGDIEGEVEAFKVRHLKVLTTDNEDTYIPYRNLLKTPVKIVKHIDSFIQKQFTISLEGDISKNLQELQKYIIMCPWVYDKKLVKISHKESNTYTVSVRVKEEFTANKIEAFIKSKVK